MFFFYFFKIFRQNIKILFLIKKKVINFYQIKIKTNYDSTKKSKKKRKLRVLLFKNFIYQFNRFIFKKC